MDHVTERRVRAMGSDVHIVVVGDAADDLIDLGLARIAVLEAWWSRFRADSELSRINAADGNPVVVSTETLTLVEGLRSAWERTDGRFDPTVYDAMNALGYDRTFAELARDRHGRDDDPYGLRTITRGSVPTVGWWGVELRADLSMVQLPQGVHLDPGGLGKGLAGDMVARELIEAGADGRHRPLQRQRPRPMRPRRRPQGRRQRPLRRSLRPKEAELRSRASVSRFRPPTAGKFPQVGVGAFPSDRTWVFPVGQDVLWDILATTDDYTRWWPWLRRFDAVGGIAVGARWTCVVAPPLPYTVKFHLDIEQVEPGCLIETNVSGDLTGTAQLTIDGGKTASTVRLVSQLRPTNVVMRAFAAVARPAVEFGHGWILDQGRRQFAERALPE